MKTTITISKRYAQQAYDALTDNSFIEENIFNEYPGTWIIEDENEERHNKLLNEVIAQLEFFNISEYEIKKE